MAEHPVDLEFQIALAMREVRLYWRPGRDPLSIDDKRRLAALILNGLKRSNITLTIVQEPPPPQGRGTGEFMR
jgi:hypothetical protein